MANVLIDNRDASSLLSLVEEIDPDLLLLLETDAWWDRELEPLKAAQDVVQGVVTPGDADDAQQRADGSALQVAHHHAHHRREHGLQSEALDDGLAQTVRNYLAAIGRAA